MEIEFDDDLKDWAEDLSEGRYTPVVQMLVQAAASHEVAEVRRVLIGSDVVVAILDEIDHTLAEAMQLLSHADFPCERLRGWVVRHREANHRLRADVVKRQVYAALSRVRH